MFMACTVIQFHHHHDDESICLLIHCDDGDLHTHHHHFGHDSHSMCNHHSHSEEGNCSLHLSESTVAPQKSLIDHNLTLTYLPRPHTLGKPQKARLCGWSLRAPPYL